MVTDPAGRGRAVCETHRGAYLSCTPRLQLQTFHFQSLLFHLAALAKVTWSQTKLNPDQVRLTWSYCSTKEFPRYVGAFELNCQRIPPHLDRARDQSRDTSGEERGASAGLRKTPSVSQSDHKQLQPQIPRHFTDFICPQPRPSAACIGLTPLLLLLILILLLIITQKVAFELMHESFYPTGDG